MKNIREARPEARARGPPREERRKRGREGEKGRKRPAKDASHGERSFSPKAERASPLRSSSRRPSKDVFLFLRSLFISSSR